MHACSSRRTPREEGHRLLWPEIGSPAGRVATGHGQGTRVERRAQPARGSGVRPPVPSPGHVRRWLQLLRLMSLRASQRPMRRTASTKLRTFSSLLPGWMCLPLFSILGLALYSRQEIAVRVWSPGAARHARRCRNSRSVRISRTEYISHFRYFQAAARRTCSARIDRPMC